MLIVMIAIYASIILYEVPKMLQKKLKRELAVFSALLSIGIILGVLLLLDVKIPSPTKEVYVFIRDVLQLSFEYFTSAIPS